jgi:hypothetical protein
MGMHTSASTNIFQKRIDSAKGNSENASVLAFDLDKPKKWSIDAWLPI